MTTRRRPATLVLIATSVLVLTASIGPAVPGVAAASKQSSNIDRAVKSYDALQKYFYVGSPPLYLEEYPRSGGNDYSYVWPFSQAMAATNDMSGIRSIGASYAADARDRLAGLQLYWNDTTTPTRIRLLRPTAARRWRRQVLRRQRVDRPRTSSSGIG